MKRGWADRFFSKDCIGVSKTRGVEGSLAQIYFALPNDTNTISWLTEQIESPSLFPSLTLCPCLSVSLPCTHFITLSSATDHHTHIQMLPYIDVLHSPKWMLLNCMWVSSLPMLKPEDMEFVSLPIQQSQGAACEPTALLESGP